MSTTDNCNRANEPEESPEVTDAKLKLAAEAQISDFVKGASIELSRIGDQLRSIATKSVDNLHNFDAILVPRNALNYEVLKEAFPSLKFKDDCNTVSIEVSVNDRLVLTCTASKKWFYGEYSRTNSQKDENLKLAKGESTRKGVWYRDGLDWRCSRCKHRYLYIEDVASLSECPNCHAKMEKYNEDSKKKRKPV